jgi:hypothetical protein
MVGIHLQEPMPQDAGKDAIGKLNTILALITTVILLGLYIVVTIHVMKGSKYTSIRNMSIMLAVCQVGSALTAYSFYQLNVNDNTAE